MFYLQNGGRVMGEDEAARVIQAGFKSMSLKRRSTGSSIVTVVPNENGDSAKVPVTGAGPAGE